MELKKTYLLTERDYIDYVLFVSRIKIYIYLGIAIIIFAIPNLFIDLSLFSIIYNLPMLFLLYVGRNAPFKIYAEYAYIKKGYSDTQINIFIDNTSIVSTMGYKSLKPSWSDIEKATESKKDYFIYLTLSEVIFLPKYQLSTNEKDILRQLINDNLDPKKNKLRKH